MKLIEKSIFHPILFGVYPVLELYANNMGQIGLVMVIRSFLFGLTLSGVTLLFLFFVLHNWHKAGLVASAAMLLFFSYGRAKDGVSSLPIVGTELGRQRVLITVWVVLLLVWFWLVIKKIQPIAWTKYLNIVSIILIIIPLVSILLYMCKQERSLNIKVAKNSSAVDLSVSIPENQTFPDIYYIILDTYTRQDTLLERFQFDNSSFISELRNRGFYVADCSQSNYASTVLSLTSSLNMSYLDSLDSGMLPSNTDTTTLYPYLLNNTIWQLAHLMGYTRIALDTGFSPTDFTDADVFLTQEGDLAQALSLKGLNSFETLVLQTSAGRIIYDHYKNSPDKSVFFDYAYIIYRNRILYELNQLERIPSRPGHKFVFTHLLAPHNPFVFGSNGEEIIRWSPFTLNNDLDSLSPGAYVSGYVNEILYLNQRILNIVDLILSRSKVQPIIIIQGDHGSPRVRENMTILNAYYLPNSLAEGKLYSSISPVNSFRIILNTYFGARLQLLPDISYYSTTEEPFLFTKIQDFNPGCVAP
jgi:hypothetical protein